VQWKYREIPSCLFSLIAGLPQIQSTELKQQGEDFFGRHWQQDPDNVKSEHAKPGLVFHREDVSIADNTRWKSILDETDVRQNVKYRKLIQKLKV